MLELDHVALAVTDLDLAGATLRDGLGLASYAGGAHRSGATANRIVPLDGGAYLELIQVIDAIAAASDPFGARVARASNRRMQLWSRGQCEPRTSTASLRG